MGTMMVDEVARRHKTYIINSFDHATSVFSIFKYLFLYLYTRLYCYDVRRDIAEILPTRR